MTKWEAVGLLTSAGFQVKCVWELPNGYGGGQARLADCLESSTYSIEGVVFYLRRPWWLLLTDHGPIQVGWRKSVINIDWSATPFRGRVQTDEAAKGTDVTWDNTFTHAWSPAKAVEYLTSLRQNLEALKPDTFAAGVAACVRWFTERRFPATGTAFYIESLKALKR